MNAVIDCVIRQVMSSEVELAVFFWHRMQG